MSKKGSLVAAAAALATLAGGAAAAPSATAAPAPTVRPAAASPAITATPSTTEADVRQVFVVSGRAGAHAKVQVQVLVGGRWSNVGRPGTADARGTYGVRTYLTQVGHTAMRVVTVNRGSTGASKPFGMTGYGWYHLTDVKMADGHRVDSYSIGLGGKNYSQSVTGGFNGFNGDTRRWFFTLNRRCNTLHTVVAPSDNNTSPKALGHFSALLDNVEAATVDAVTFKPQTLDTDISGSIRLTLQMIVEAEGRYGFGDPMVRCSSDPTA